MEIRSRFKDTAPSLNDSAWAAKVSTNFLYYNVLSRHFE